MKLSNTFRAAALGFTLAIAGCDAPRPTNTAEQPPTAPTAETRSDLQNTLGSSVEDLPRNAKRYSICFIDGKYAQAPDSQDRDEKDVITVTVESVSHGKEVIVQFPVPPAHEELEPNRKRLYAILAACELPPPDPRFVPESAIKTRTRVRYRD